VILAQATDTIGPLKSSRLIVLLGYWALGSLGR